jgi:uncharacterized protein (DUF1015 family)
MATIKPFKAVRPVVELAEKVAALPYDVMNAEEAREMVKENSYSFLHVDKAEIDLAQDIDPYDQAVYAKANDNLNKMISQGIYFQDNKENLYIYRQVMNGRIQTGLVACPAVDEYLNNMIKKHEYTRPDKEQDRVNHVDVTNSQTGPIFLTYRAEEEISKIIDDWANQYRPVYDFTAEDGINHTCWVIDDNETINKLVNAFKGIDCLYIADGHHRAASAVRVCLKRRQQNPGFSGQEEYNFFLAVLFPHSQLRIMDYNRLIKDLNNHSVEDFLNKIKEKFYVEKYEGSGPCRPEYRHSFGMYLRNSWYKLEAKPGTFDENDPVERLDVSILQKNLLQPVLGIDDPRTDKRIDFVGGIRGLAELERRVGEDMEVAFAMHPTSIEELMAIADAGEVMPPKSTWFEPKLRSGIFIHKLSD